MHHNAWLRSLALPYAQVPATRPSGAQSEWGGTPKRGGCVAWYPRAPVAACAAHCAAPRQEPSSARARSIDDQNVRFARQATAERRPHPYPPAGTRWTVVRAMARSFDPQPPATAHKKEITPGKALHDAHAPVRVDRKKYNLCGVVVPPCPPRRSICSWPAPSLSG